jgi:hypothetical protein
LPEVWFPYGGVETLVTIQAENLGNMIEPSAERIGVETERITELLKETGSLFVCDLNPSTIELLRDMVGLAGAALPARLFTSETKRLESSIPELKGKCMQLPLASAAGEVHSPPSGALAESGKKVFLATARPDPHFGMIDARISAATAWVPGAATEAAGARRDFEPTPFQRTEPYEKAESIAAEISGAVYLTVVPRGGRVRSVLEDAPFDAVKNGFLESALPPTKGLIVGAGGKSYDDTFSSALRAVWGVMSSVRKSGEVLLIAECSDGVGSPALQLYASGRMTGEGGRRKEKYVAGLEEVYYLSKLRDEYGVLLLSGLPEIFAKNKLGLATARGSGEAVGRLLNKLGRSAKVNVITRSAECRISSG